MNKQKALQALWDALCLDGEPTKGGSVISDIEVAHFLATSASGLMFDTCSNPLCDVCNAFNKVWWDWMAQLSGPVRVRVQRLMLDHGIEFPPAPWEEVPTNAVPTALN